MSSDTERPEDPMQSRSTDRSSDPAPDAVAPEPASRESAAASSGALPTSARGDTGDERAGPDHSATEAAPDASAAADTAHAESDRSSAEYAPDDSTSAESGGAEASAEGEESAGANRYDSPGDTPKYSPALIATAVALPVALIVAVLLIAVMSRQNTDREPLALGSVPAPAAGGPGCAALLPALPDALGDYTRAELAQPAPPATVAWQLPDGGEPIVLRCGLDRPLEFDKASALQIINGVTWFEVRDRTSGVTSGTWFAVDRGTYIAVTVADSAGPTPLQDISDTLTKTVPAQPIDPGPLPN
ncbi:DUF3515 domain-containing protein [Nocardia wallacei]|uniref:DUF3515 domain-containing protein n=1 Tax=Nocardia wallacei TaxID=480035 RepID=UPI002457932C|nr:DUF3515 domain-containing protein [Nocardia wallacei]